MIVPTGIGASIGGYAGDAMPACKLLAKASDLLITHPNVVNAATITDIPSNVAVVEGYLLDRFFAGQVALRLDVKHRIGVVVDSAATEEQRIITENAINAARNVYGLEILDKIIYTSETIAADLTKGIMNPETLLEACVQAREQGATALAVLAVMKEDPQSQAAVDYANGQGYDPIGKLEAKISHLVSSIFLLPSAHAPLLVEESRSSSAAVLVHPRVAAEYISETFLMSVFKCLQHSPQIIPLPQAYKLLSNYYTDPAALNLKQKPDDIVVSDLANLVVPYNCCNGVPMIEANKNQIELLCVRNNVTNLDDRAEIFGIPHHLVANYLEAAGFLLANSKDKAAVDYRLLYT